ncbi:MAG: peroxiredoxin [Pseudohongiellaceae bacterium]|jgi:peroxiredoxin
MRSLRCLAATILFFYFCLSIAVASELKLPNQLPELSITSTELLGHNEPGIGLDAGETVKQFTITDHFGASTSFPSLLDKGNSLVIFYRGGWCPYCNMQIKQLTDAWPEFEKRAITPVLISADKPDAAMMMQRGYEIPFPVLSDPELIAHKAFNVIFTLPEKLISAYKEYGVDLEDWSGQGHHQFAVSSAFIVDTKGTIKWAHSSLDYKTRPSVKQLLSAIDELKK